MRPDLNHDFAIVSVIALTCGFSVNETLLRCAELFAGFVGLGWAAPAGRGHRPLYH
jgi:hypothetical protein